MVELHCGKKECEDETSRVKSNLWFNLGYTLGGHSKIRGCFLEDFLCDKQLRRLKVLQNGQY